MEWDMVSSHWTAESGASPSRGNRSRRSFADLRPRLLGRDGAAIADRRRLDTTYVQVRPSRFLSRWFPRFRMPKTRATIWAFLVGNGIFFFRIVSVTATDVNKTGMGYGEVPSRIAELPRSRWRDQFNKRRKCLSAKSLNDRKAFRKICGMTLRSLTWTGST